MEHYIWMVFFILLGVNVCNSQELENDEDLDTWLNGTERVPDTLLNVTYSNEALDTIKSDEKELGTRMNSTGEVIDSTENSPGPWMNRTEETPGSAMDGTEDGMNSTQDELSTENWHDEMDSTEESPAIAMNRTMEELGDTQNSTTDELGPGLNSTESEFDVGANETEDVTDKEDEETIATSLSCNPDVETPVSIHVNSIRISGRKVNRIVPPFGYTKEEWEYWEDMDYNVTTEITYTVKQPSHCTRNKIFYRCTWPNPVLNVVWFLSDEKGNFTQSSVSTMTPNGDLVTTVTATDPSVIPTVTTFLSLQSENLIFRYDYIFSQSDYSDNSFALSYSPITFHCYPPTTVRFKAGHDLLLSWSYTIQLGPGETNQDLLGKIVSLRGYMLDRNHRQSTPRMNYYRFQATARLAGSGLDNSTVWNNGIWTLGPDDQKIGTISRQVEEIEDGYTGVLQLHFPPNIVGKWLKGAVRMDFGGMSTVTHIAIDEENTNNRTREYLLNYDCPFDLDMLNVALRYGSGWGHTEVSGDRFMEIEPGLSYHNRAKHLQCEVHGCSVDKVELLRNGQPVRYIFQPHISDNVLERGYGAYKTIRVLFTRGNEDTYGTYECRATDKSGNSTSMKIDIIKKREVKVKILEWTEGYVILSCRASGDPLPTVTFGEKIADYNREVSPLRLPGEMTINRPWIVEGPWYVRPDGPFGHITEGVLNITMPADTMKGRVIFCTSHSIYGTQTASVGLDHYKFPREPKTWDRAY